MEQRIFHHWHLYSCVNFVKLGRVILPISFLEREMESNFIDHESKENTFGIIPTCNFFNPIIMVVWSWYCPLLALVKSTSIYYANNRCPCSRLYQW